MVNISLYDRVRLPNGQEGTVMGCDGFNMDSEHVIVSLQKGGTISILAAVLIPIVSFSPDVDMELKIELDDSLRMIARVTSNNN